MNIEKILLTNYRNYDKLELEFEPAINLVTGPNGIGKTNILEAVNVLATTKSFRAKYDRDLIKHDKDFAKIEATIKSEDDKENLQLHIIRSARSENTSTKKVLINNVPKTLNNFSHYFKCVLFSPEDIDLITGSPSFRRKGLDAVLYQVDEKYKKAINEYHKVVRRRNKLLEIIKDTGSSRDQLPYWDEKLIELGQFITEKRREFITHVNKYLNSRDNPYANYAKVLEIKYEPNTVSAERIAQYNDKEIYTKTTLVGPHRDDFSFLQDKKDMAQFASRGEQRTAVFLVKLAEFDYITLSTGTKPILLLDDIFSELDETHKEAILSFINDNQTIITSATAEDLPEIYISKTIVLE